MKSLLFITFFAGITWFSYPTDLAPNLNHAVDAISTAAKINPSFVNAVIATANPSGEIPDSYDLFGTGEKYTSCASSICNFVRFIQKQGLDPCVLESDPEMTTRLLARMGVLRDSSNILDKLQWKKP